MANTKEGTFIRSNTWRFRGPGQNVFIEACGYRMSGFGRDCLGPIPDFTYLKLMGRTWVWISRPQLGPGPKRDGIKLGPGLKGDGIKLGPGLKGDGIKLDSGLEGDGTEGGTSVDTPRITPGKITPGPETDERSEKDQVARPGLNIRVCTKYKEIQLETLRLKERREGLRKLDTLNRLRESSDDSIDEPKMAFRPLGGIKPRTKKSKRSRIHKQPDRQSKKIYPYSDSENDSAGHDPTGAARSNKRVRLSQSVENLTLYIQKSPPEKVPHLRSLVRPADTLLNKQMSKGQLSSYYQDTPSINGAVVNILTGDKPYNLNISIFRRGYQGIVQHLKEKDILEEGGSLWYITPKRPARMKLDSENAFIQLYHDLSDLPVAKKKGTIDVQQLPQHEFNLVVDGKKTPVPRSIWLRGGEAVKQYLLLFKMVEPNAFLSYGYTPTEGASNPPNGTIEPLLNPSKVAETVTISITDSTVMVFVNHSISTRPRYLGPKTSRRIDKWNSNLNKLTVRLSEFPDLEAFMKFCLKGKGWDPWYPSLVSAAYYIDPKSGAIPTVDDKLPMVIFNDKQYASLSKMTFKPTDALVILCSKAFIGKEVC